MHFLVDGYNLLFRVIKGKKSLESKRDLLLSFLNEQADAFHLQLTVIFDAAVDKHQEFSRHHRKHLEIIYTSAKQSADECILTLLEETRKPHGYMVITSDRELKSRAKALGANTQTIDEFLTELSGKTKKKQKKRQEAQQVTVKDSPQNIERLRKIFEERLRELD